MFDVPVVKIVCFIANKETGIQMFVSINDIAGNK
jgi:hypothetical protein